MVYKATKLGESIFERQSEMLMPEEELGSQSSVSYEEDFEDLSSNADLYVFNDPSLSSIFPFFNLRVHEKVGAGLVK